MTKNEKIETAGYIIASIILLSSLIAGGLIR